MPTTRKNYAILSVTAASTSPYGRDERNLHDALSRDSRSRMPSKHCHFSLQTVLKHHTIEVNIAARWAWSLWRSTSGRPGCPSRIGWRVIVLYRLLSRYSSGLRMLADPGTTRTRVMTLTARAADFKTEGHSGEAMEKDGDYDDEKTRYGRNHGQFTNCRLCHFLFS